jgi:aspartate aminotransferase/aminotransferase
MVSERIRKLDSSGIRKVFDLASKLENPINLSIGQPHFDVPEDVKQEAIKSIKDGFNKYTVTQGMSELREKLVKKFRRENNIETEPNNVIVTSGVMGGLVLAFSVIFDKGDEVIVPDPYFMVYKHLASFFDAKPVFVNTYEDFKLNVQAIEESITSKTKAIIINSPSNPTGTVYSKKELIALSEVAMKHDLIVISDEIYEKFIYDNEKHFSIGSVYENTLTLNGFSKSHSMTGWRIGYATGPRNLIKEMIKLQQYSFVCAPSFAQKAALKALDSGKSGQIRKYEKKRNLIYNGLKNNFKIVKPKGAFYIFPKVPKGTGEEFVKKAIEKNLLIVPGNVFSEQDTNFRVSFAAPDETIQQGIEVLNELAEG